VPLEAVLAVAEHLPGDLGYPPNCTLHDVCPSVGASCCWCAYSVEQSPASVPSCEERGKDGLLIVRRRVLKDVRRTELVVWKGLRGSGSAEGPRWRARGRFLGS
jgi:hypothetical protein